MVFCYDCTIEGNKPSRSRTGGRLHGKKSLLSKYRRIQQRMINCSFHDQEVALLEGVFAYYDADEPYAEGPDEQAL